MKKAVIAVATLAVSAGGALAEELCFNKADLSYEPCEETFGAPADFSGVYAGGHLGFAGSDFSGLFDEAGGDLFGDPVDDPFVDLNESASAFAVGLHAGVMYRYDADFVIGFEVDASYADLSASASSGSGESIRGEIEYFGSARVRAGTPVESFMPYVTGGIGFISYDYVVQDGGGTSEDSANFEEAVFGGVAGAGVEVLLTDDIMLRAEGLYYFVDEQVDLADEQPTDADPGDFVAIDDLWTARTGLSFKF